MEKDSITLRVVTPDDAEELLAIYAPYVTDTAVSFEYEVPGAAEFRERIRRTLIRYPYLAAVQDGKILGYACTHSFIERPAYNWSAETTIYLNASKRGMGIGRRLYTALEQISSMQNILSLNACIGYPETEDEYLTRASARFHERLGFRLVGTFTNSGCKFGRWYHMIWMEKLIGEHLPFPAPVVPFPELDAKRLRAAGVGLLRPEADGGASCPRPPE